MISTEYKKNIFDSINQRIFISYSRKDITSMEMIRTFICSITPESNVFVDNRKIKGGDRWERIITDEISRCDLFVVIWSSNARKSKWVNREIELAHKMEIISNKPRIIPILMDRTKLCTCLNVYQSVFLRPIDCIEDRYLEQIIFILIWVVSLIGISILYKYKKIEGLTSIVIFQIWYSITLFIGLRNFHAPWHSKLINLQISFLAGTFQLSKKIAEISFFASICIIVYGIILLSLIL